MASAWLFSFFSTVFLFFLRASQVSESRWCGEHGPPLQGFSERGGGERRTTASACERSRGGVNECGWCPFHSSTHTISGCQQRGHTLIHRSLLSNADGTRDFIIYWSKRWLFPHQSWAERVQIHQWLIRSSSDLSRWGVWIKSVMQTLRVSVFISTSHVCFIHQVHSKLKIRVHCVACEKKSVSENSI